MRGLASGGPRIAAALVAGGGDCYTLYSGRAVEGAGESRNGAAGAVWAESLARYPLIVRCRESYCYHCLTGVIDDNNTVDGHIGSIYLLRVRLKITRNARIKHVGKFKSCMAYKLLIIFKRTRTFEALVRRDFHSRIFILSPVVFMLHWAV